MKKFLLILMVICMMASMLCVPAFAAESAFNGMMVANGQKEDGTIEAIRGGTDFEDIWNSTMELAGDSDRMKEKQYDRVIVTLYADWNAVDGNFTDDAWYETNGAGFNNDTIYIPDDARVTLDLNGHTINRGLEDNQRNGEVIYIDADADVIIKNGTITGGWSSNGAGGIYINDGANVTLNDVNVVGNTGGDDEGGGIALYNGATLTMNGGSFRDNRLSGIYRTSCGGAVYVEESTAVFTDVEFKNNTSDRDETYGVAIYADDSRITLNNCTFEENSIVNINWNYPNSVIYAYDSSFTVNNSTFINSKTRDLFYFEDSSLTMEGDKVTGNNADKLFNFKNSDADINGITITDNASKVINVDNSSKKVNMTDCTLGNNTPNKDAAEVIVKRKGTLVLTNCTLGDTTYENKGYITFANGSSRAMTGSIFGEGSLTMIVAFVALIASVASLIVNVTARKKKTAPVTPTEQTDNE